MGKKQEKASQGQSREMQSTHDKVNQCHGSQNGSLALLNQACGGPEEGKKAMKIFYLCFWDLNSISTMSERSCAAISGKQKDMLYINIYNTLLEWTLVHKMLHLCLKMSGAIKTYLFIFKYFSVVSDKAGFLCCSSAGWAHVCWSVCVCVRVCVLDAWSYDIKVSVILQLCCDLCK